MNYQKQYANKIGWKNSPDTSTPINATNLNKVDNALWYMDNALYVLSRVIAGGSSAKGGIITNVGSNTFTTHLEMRSGENLSTGELLLLRSNVNGSGNGINVYVDESMAVGFGFIDLSGTGTSVTLTNTSVLLLMLDAEENTAQVLSVLGEGGGSYTAGTGISITNNVITNTRKGALSGVIDEIISGGYAHTQINNALDSITAGGLVVLKAEASGTANTVRIQYGEQASQSQAYRLCDTDLEYATINVSVGDTIILMFDTTGYKLIVLSILNNSGGSGGDSYAGLGVGKMVSVTNNVIDTDIDLHRAPMAGDRLLIWFDTTVQNPTGLTTYNNGTAVTSNLETVIPLYYNAGWNIVEYMNDGLLYNNVWVRQQNVQDALSKLSDTLINSPTDGQVLTYNGTSGKWVNQNAEGGSGNTKLKTRYSVTYSSWSSVVNSDGYYTYNLSLNPTITTIFSPDVLIAGSNNITQPTDTEKTMFGYVERCYLSGSTLTLYAKTKPTSGFYIWVEGVAGSGSGGIVGNVIQPNGESEFTNVTTLHVLNQAGAGDERWNDPSTEPNGQYRNYFAYGTAADITKIRASKYIRVNILRKYTSGFDLWSTTLIDVATLKSIETAQNSRQVRVVLTSPDTFYLYPVGNIFIYPLGTVSQDRLLVQFAESTQLYDMGEKYRVYDVIIDCI